MKTISYVFLVFLCLSTQLSANSLSLKISSKNFEYQSGNIPIQITCLVKDSVQLDGGSELAVAPENFTWSSTSVNTSYLPGDSVSITGVLSYDVNAMPFYLREVIIEQSYNGSSIASISFYVYLTPYGTTEIWNTNEVFSQKRAWFRDISAAQERVTLNKEDIPESTLPDNFQETVPDSLIGYQQVPGLAYAVPMLIDPADLVDEEEPSSNLRKGGSQKLFGICEWNYRGHIRGRLVGWIKDDFGNWRKQPLRGIRVKVKRVKELFVNVTQATLTTDENGEFDYYYWTSSACDRDGRRFFLKIFAENEKHDIKATHNWIMLQPDIVQTSFKNMREGKGSDNNIDYGDIVCANTHRAVHLANNAWEFAERHGVLRTRGLTLRFNNTDGSFFFPNTLDGKDVFWIAAHYPCVREVVSIISKVNGRSKPWIFLDGQAADMENTVYHEFGHFLMWFRQNKSWIDICEGSFASHSPTKESNSKIAWTEGFANGFMAMVDAYWRSDDGEYGFDDDINYNERNNIDFNVGINSELNIGAALFDLYDGAFLGGNTWHDNQRDQLQLSVFDIMSPINSQKCQSIEDYYRKLLEIPKVKDDCVLKSEVSQIFRLNDVVADGKEYDQNLPIEGNTDLGYGVLASGPITQNTSISNVGTVFPQFSLFRTYDYNFTEDIIVQNETNNGLLGLWVKDHMEPLTDPLYFASNNPIGYKSMMVVSDNDTKIKKLKTCGRGSINNRGVIDLGRPNNTGPVNMVIEKGAFLSIRSGSEVRINANSQLSIGDEGTLRIHANGKLVIEKGAKLNILEGAYVCINPGAIIETPGGTLLESLGTLEPHNVGVNPYTGLTTTTCTSVEDLVPHNHGFELAKVKEIDCTNGEFHFKLNGTQTWDPSRKVIWSFPAKWKKYHNPNGPWYAYEYNGTINDNGNNDNLDGGTVRVLIRSDKGIEQLSLHIPDIDRPEIVPVTDRRHYICRNEPGKIGVQVTGGVVSSNSDYDFNWKKHWGLSFTEVQDGNKNYLRFNNSQWSTTKQNVSVSVTDLDGCESNTVNFEVYPNYQSWRNWMPSTQVGGGTAQVGALKSAHANVVVDVIGNVYYISENNKIATFNWDTEAIIWRNSEFTMNGVLASGPMQYYNTGTEEYIYYITTTGDIASFKSTGVDGTWNKTNLNIQSNIVNKSSSTLLVTPASYPYCYYVNDEKLYLSNDNVNPVSSNLGHLRVKSKNVVNHQGILYFRNDNAYLQSFNTTTGFSTIYTNIRLMNNTKLDVDYGGNLWFMGESWNIQSFKIPTSTYVNNIWGLGNGAGTFSLNKGSGVVYVPTSGGDVKQLYKDGNGAWTTNTLQSTPSKEISKYDIQFAYPNVYYVANSGELAYFYFSTQGCEPSIIRTGDIRTTFGVYPNPADENFVITFNSSEFVGKHLKVTNLTGATIYDQDLPESEIVNINTAEWSSGLYLIQVYGSNNEIKTEKILIE